MTLESDVLRWFAVGEVGISSRALACAVAGLPQKDRRNWPRDPDDLRRCLLFLDAVPEARDRMSLASSLGHEWARLIEGWGELEALFKEEVLDIHDCFGVKAPRTYQRMKEFAP